MMLWVGIIHVMFLIFINGNHNAEGNTNEIPSLLSSLSWREVGKLFQHDNVIIKHVAKIMRNSLRIGSESCNGLLIPPISAPLGISGMSWVIGFLPGTSQMSSTDIDDLGRMKSSCSELNPQRIMHLNERRPHPVLSYIL